MPWVKRSGRYSGETAGGGHAGLMVMLPPRIPFLSLARQVSDGRAATLASVVWAILDREEFTATDSGKADGFLIGRSDMNDLARATCLLDSLGSIFAADSL